MALEISVENRPGQSVLVLYDAERTPCRCCGQATSRRTELARRDLSYDEAQELTPARWDNLMADVDCAAALLFPDLQLSAPPGF